MDTGESKCDRTRFDWLDWFESLMNVFGLDASHSAHGRAW